MSSGRLAPLLLHVFFDIYFGWRQLPTFSIQFNCFQLRFGQGGNFPFEGEKAMQHFLLGGGVSILAVNHLLLSSFLSNRQKMQVQKWACSLSNMGSCIGVRGLVVWIFFSVVYPSVGRNCTYYNYHKPFCPLSPLLPIGLSG